MGPVEHITFTPATGPMRPAIVDLLRLCALPVEDLSAVLNHFFVAKVGARVVGSVGLEALGDIALFRSLAVHPEYRGQGIGGRLFEEARHRARQLEARELFLLTTTAEPLFARWGFSKIPREEAPPAIQATPEYRTLCAATAVTMRLSLRPPA